MLDAPDAARQLPRHMPFSSRVMLIRRPLLPLFVDDRGDERYTLYFSMRERMAQHTTTRSANRCAPLECGAQREAASPAVWFSRRFIFVCF